MQVMEVSFRQKVFDGYPNQEKKSCKLNWKRFFEHVPDGILDLPSRLKTFLIVYSTPLAFFCLELTIKV